MLIGGRTAAWAGTSAMPYDYEVEYISNNGSERHFDTGVYWQQGDTAQIVTAQNAVNDQAAFGVTGKIYGFSNNGAGGGNPRGFFWGNAPYAGGSEAALPFEYGTSKHTITVGENYCDVDGTTISGSAILDTSDSLHTVILFARAANTAVMSYTKTYNGKIYSFKYWRSGTLLIDYLPVVDFDGVACFYDRVSNSLVYGTGTFTAGPEI